MTSAKLDEGGWRANLGAARSAILGCALVLGACAATPPVDGVPPEVRADGYPDLRSVPDPPELDDEIQRRTMGDTLLADLAGQTHAAEALRFRVGLRGSPPGPIEPPPMLPPPEPERLRPPRPSEQLVARYLRQQVQGELDTDDLNSLLDKIAAEPIDLEGLTAAGVTVRPRKRKSGEALPEYVSNADAVPLIDQALVAIGVEEAPP